MLRALLVVFALVVVACGGSLDTAAPITVPNRPQAPDFTLELGDGGEFTLSAGTKPVYMIFWAEW